MSTAQLEAPLYDVLIAGGGLVGSSLACALDGSPLKVALVDATAPGPLPPPSFDERNLALNRLSLDALDALGVLERLDSPPVPILGVHVSSAGDFGRVRLRPRDHGVEAFGGVAVARELGAALDRRLSACAGLSRIQPARVVGAHFAADALEVQLEGDRHLRARLLVVAEGTDSALRGQLGLGEQRKDYGQTLFVCVVEAEREHEGIAYERFTSSGPVAFLPLAGKRMGSVLTVDNEEADAVAALDETAYLEFLQQRFGWRLGKLLRAGKRSAYPMRLVTAERCAGPRSVVVGNAAQTLHPVGAQGFNLGLRDALTLAGLLRIDPVRDPGDAERLQQFVELRAGDRERTLDFSDGLIGLFAHGSWPVRALRGLGLAALDHFPALARPLVRGAMGRDPHSERVIDQLRELGLDGASA
jgi:2-octaprenyl-6-methoxyphenol hydroxylase